jgi:hypothetical protein
MEKETNNIVFNGLFKKGMIFHEMLTFWLGILDINEQGIITTLEGNRIRDMKIKKYTKEELTKFMMYSTRQGCWLDYRSTELEKVQDWFKLKIDRETNKDNLRDFKIDFIL